MPSMLTLRELDVQDTTDEPLLHEFERCRHEVVRMTSSALLPDCIAVATRGGFVELIHVATGVFRLFLTHLGPTPLQTPLRCLALLPSQFASSGRHHLLYALAHSNELLLADTTTGAVHVLAAFNSRPSAVFADGDCVACGEGCGQVALWHAQGEDEDSDNNNNSKAAAPALAWRRAVFDDAVACLVAQRDWLVCSAVDYSCRVLAMDTGALVAALPQGPAPAIALQPAARGTLTALCLPTSLAVFTTPTAAPAAERPWDCAALVRLDVEVSCASCCGDLIACGAAAGVVLLLAIDPREDYAIAECVRFDVGFPVIGIQLFADGTLVVVTAAGDVWKWPVEDLLQGTGYNERDEDAAKRTEEEVPQPNAQPPEAAAASPRGDRRELLPTGCGRLDEPDNEYKEDKEDKELPATDEADAIVVMMDHEEEVHKCQHQDDEDADEEDENNTEEEEEEEMGDEEDNEGNDHEEECGEGAAVNSVEDNEVGYLGPSLSPSTVSLAGWTTAAAETVLSAPAATATAGRHPHRHACGPLSPNAAGRADGDAYAPGHSNGHRVVPTSGDDSPSADPSDSEAGGEVRALSPRPCARDPSSDNNNNKNNNNSGAALRQLLRGTAIGSPVAIEGLRRGRRMDPRRARHMAEQRDIAPDAPDLTENQSTRLLLDYRQTLTEAVFDPATYAQAHALQAEALRYRHPVRLPVCGPRAQVFAEVLRLCERPTDANAEAPPTADDLIDTTFRRFVRKKDTALEEERRRGGPDIQRHMCDALLYSAEDPSGTVLFDERASRPDAPDTLLLPMPLPPTPSVF